MRIRPAFLLLAAFSLALATSTAFARQSSVLLPSDDTPSGGNLGLSPLPQTTPPSTTSGNSNSGAAQGSVAPGAASTTTTPTAPIDIMSMSTGAQGRLYGFDQMVAKAKADHEKKFRVDSIITNAMDPSAGINTNLPSTFAINADKKYTWGKEEAGMISKILGYTADKIPAVCTMRLDARLNTDKGIYPAYLEAGQATTAYFDGLLQEISFTAKALCTPPAGELPSGGAGIVFRAGDKYMVVVGQPASCGEPKRNSTILDLRYEGDGKITCRYR